MIDSLLKILIIGNSILQSNNLETKIDSALRLETNRKINIEYNYLPGSTGQKVLFDYLFTKPVDMVDKKYLPIDQYWKYQAYQNVIKEKLSSYDLLIIQSRTICDNEFISLLNYITSNFKELNIFIFQNSNSIQWNMILKKDDLNKNLKCLKKGLIPNKRIQFIEYGNLEFSLNNDSHKMEINDLTNHPNVTCTNIIIDLILKLMIKCKLL